MTNYLSQAERLNPKAEEMKKEMKSLLPVPEIPAESGSFPFLDHIIFLTMTEEDIHHRISTMKVDPTTGTVYDPVVNPVPETDKKLVARLEPAHQPEIELLSHTTLPSLEEYFHRFGFEWENSPVILPIPGTTDVHDLDKAIIDKLKQVVKDKYSIYDQETPPHVIAQLVPEDSKDMLLGGDQSERGSLTEIISPDRRRGSKDFNSPNPPNSELKVVATQKKLVKKPSYYSAATKSQRKLDTTSQRSGGAGRAEKYLNKCLDSWDVIFKDYVETLQKLFRQARESFEILRFHFETSQKGFAKVFQEKREFNAPILAFVDSYRRFASENPDTIKNPYCKKRLFERIDAIHDNLWNEIQKCKEKAIAEKEKMVTKSLISSTTQNLSKMMLSIVANESNKLFHLK